MSELNRKIEEILELPESETEPVKDGDKLIQQLRDKAKERDKRYMEYLFKCPECEARYGWFAPYRIDGSEKVFNWN